MIFSVEEEAAGLQLLGRARETDYLRQRLHRVLLDVLPWLSEDRALSVNHGRRLLAAEILKALETPESADARSDIASLLHKPQRPVAYGDAGRRRVPDTGPDDQPDAGNRRAARAYRADRRLGSEDAA